MLSFARFKVPASFFLGGLGALSLFGMVSAVPVHAQEALPSGYAECLQTAFQNRGSGVTATQFQTTVTAISSDVAGWSCQRVCMAESDAGARCVTRGCMGTGQDATVKCCASGTGSVPTPQNVCPSGAGGGTTRSTTSSTASGTALRFTLPECTKTGNCGLGDIVNTGIRFSNFLFAIAGLIFFATFVYAGVRMLFFAYDAKSYSEAKSTMEKAVTGLVIMIMAGTVVRFIFNAFQSDTGGVTTQATDKAATTNSSKTSASTTPTP